MVLNQYAAIVSVVTVVAHAVVRRSAGPIICDRPRPYPCAADGADRSARLSSHTSDSGIRLRIPTTRSAGTADTMNARRHPIAGARRFPTIVARKRANAAPLCRYEP